MTERPKRCNRIFDPNAKKIKITRFANTIVSDLQYDPQGRLVDVTHSAGATPLQSFAYTHDAVGNILSITEPASTRNFSYDDLERLTSGGTAPAPESYSYDGIGNRTASHLSASHVTNSANRLTEDDSFCYAYDANGNLTTKTAKVAGACTGAVTTYSWNAQNQLIQIDFPDLTTASYRYDGLARRIEKDVDGVITRYVYDGKNIVLEYDGTNTLLARYSHGDGSDQPLSVERGGQSFFYQADHQGSVTQITDAAGLVVNSYEYDSYGRIELSIEGIANPFTYTGREQDPESGLFYYRARYYDPEIGRFLSEDPLGFGGGDANLFRYVFNNPVNLVDPNGQIAGVDDAVVIVVVVTTVVAGTAIACYITNCGQSFADIVENVVGSVADAIAGSPAGGDAVKNEKDDTTETVGMPDPGPVDDQGIKPDGTIDCFVIFGKIIKKCNESPICNLPPFGVEIKAACKAAAYAFLAFCLLGPIAP